MKSDRTTLRQYHDSLQEQMERARLEGAVDLVLHVGFMANGVRYLLDAKYASEAAECSPLVPIPGAMPWAAGAANIKGDVYAVTDFSLFVGGPPVAKGQFLTLDDDLLPGAALCVDRLIGLYDTEQIGQRRPLASASKFPWIVANHTINSEEFVLLDAERLVVDPKFSNLQSGEYQDDPQG